MAGSTPMIGGGHQVTASKQERKSRRRHVKHMRIGKAENGGFNVEHEYASTPDGPYEPSTNHVFGKGEGPAMLTHVAKHLRIPMAGTKEGQTPDTEPDGDEPA